MYLGYYKEARLFWQDLGRAVRDYGIIYRQKGDYEVVAGIVKEAAVFLYQQWYVLSSQRYQQLASEKKK